MTHQHVMGQLKGQGRVTALSVARGWEPSTCVVCGRPDEPVASLRFPYIPPGSNALFQMHYWEVAKWRQKLREDVAFLVPFIGPARCVERGRLTLDFRWKSRVKRDPANYVEGMKGAIDGLVGRWYIDDDTEHLELVVRGRVGTGEPDHVLLALERLFPQEEAI